MQKVIFILAIGLFLACNDSSDSEVKGLHSGLFWKNPTATVCFDEQDPAFDHTIEVVKESVQREINDKTTFKFKFLGKCSAGKADIRVKFVFRERSYASVLPTESMQHFYKDSDSHIVLGQFVPDPAWVNQNGEEKIVFPKEVIERLNKDLPAGKKIDLPSKKKIYVDQKTYNAVYIMANNVAIHEFMHGLGADHEQLRTENANGNYCRDKNGGDIGSAADPYWETRIPHGEFDANSIMNYCVAGYFTVKKGLSAGDIKMVNDLYSQGQDGDYAASKNKSDYFSTFEEKAVEYGCTGKALAAPIKPGTEELNRYIGCITYLNYMYTVNGQAKEFSSTSIARVQEDDLEGFHLGCTTNLFQEYSFDKKFEFCGELLSNLLKKALLYGEKEFISCLGGGGGYSCRSKSENLKES